VLLKQIPQVEGFDGLMDLYMMDLQSGSDLHIVSAGGHELAHKPDIAFSAASTIKIGILVAVYRYLGSPLDAQTLTWLNGMITQSYNTSSDSLMEEIDRVRGPLVVTDMLGQLGLQNTFLAGYFRNGAPLLRQFQTPANQRTDINTSPDPYDQTTPTDMGALLVDLYQCAQDNGGTLRLTFPQAVSQQDCQQMLDLLAQDNIAVLIQAGVPDGIRVAHKHGWITDAQGNINHISDAAVVYTPGGNYVLTIYLWKDGGLIWDRDSKLVADLSRAVYNYFNPPSPSP
jgi:beta-lactamase class A